MILTEFCEMLTNTKEEADQLYEADNLYIVWAQSTTSYTNLTKFVNELDEEYYEWKKELRGKNRKTAKLEDPSETLQGYAFNVTKDNADFFEMSALGPSMKYSYRFQTHNFNEVKKQEQEQIIDTLSKDE